MEWKVHTIISGGQTGARPCLQVFPDDGWRDGLKEFLDLNAIRILNVAGSRASRAPGIEAFVQDVLDEARRHLAMRAG